MRLRTWLLEKTPTPQIAQISHILSSPTAKMEADSLTFTEDGIGLSFHFHEPGCVLPDEMLFRKQRQAARDEKRVSIAAGFHAYM
jgi:hypothetical protein